MYCDPNSEVIVIVGPTGSGKTGVSLEIAEEVKKCSLGGYLGAEIISADSRAIYKEMDLGTAKPTPEEQSKVKHWGLDLVYPGERFTVADWKEYAERKIEEISRRGNLPIVVGGTGLYIDALVFDYQFGKNAKKFQLEQEKCADKIDEQVLYPDRQEMCSRYKIFGIKVDSETLRERLKKRANKLFTQELCDETKKLIGEYGWENQAMKSNIYQFVWGYLNGEYSLERAKELNVFDDYHLAKRQMTWFKRNENILWLPLEKVKAAVIKCIQDEQRK